MANREEYCAAMVAQAFPMPPTSVEDVRRQLAIMRSRPIELVRTEPGELGGPLGLWIRRPDVDIVWVHPGITPLHADVVELHEYGHMCLGHEPELLDASGRPGAINLAMAAHLSGTPMDSDFEVFGRCDDALPLGSPLRLLEEEAETFARLLAEPILGDHEAEFADVLEGSDRRSPRTAARRHFLAQLRRRSWRSEPGA